MATLHDIADKSTGAVRPTMEAVYDAFYAYTNRTSSTGGTDAQVKAAFAAVKTQCAGLGVSAQS